MLDDGTPVQLNEDEVMRAAAIGLKTVADRQREKTKAAPAPAQEPETKNKEEPKKAEELVDREARAKLDRISNRETFREIESIVNKADIPDEWKDVAKQEVLTTLALTRQYIKDRGGDPDTVDLSKISEPVMKSFRERVEKTKGGKTVVNVDEKSKDKKETELTTGSGKTAGQTAEKPLGRQSFRDGTLAKQIHQRFKNLAKKATE